MNVSLATIIWIEIGNKELELSPNSEGWEFLFAIVFEQTLISVDSNWLYTCKVTNKDWKLSKNVLPVLQWQKHQLLMAYTTEI